jgi:glycosyltransferase involved in cell wall biosynthesis
MNPNDDGRLKVLILTSDYSGPRGAPWLMDDLVDEFVRRGHLVSVMAIDNKNPWRPGINLEVIPDVQLFGAGPGKRRVGTLGKLLNQVITAWRLHTSGYRWASRQNFDLIVYTSIGLFSWGFPRRLKMRGRVKRSAMVLWDFFPIQHIEIGRISRRIPAPPLKMLERQAIKRADALIVMTPANRAYLESYHRGLTARIAIAAPWSALPSDEFEVIEAERGRREDQQTFRLLWAGQMIEGRGLDVLFEALAELEITFPELTTVVVGDGPKRVAFEELSSSWGLTSVRFAGRLPRGEYRDMLTHADAGIAITVPNVTIPTFSAKISEFCAYGVPVIVSIEPSSDAGLIVQGAGAGVTSTAGDVIGLKQSLTTLLTAKKEGTLGTYSMAARRLFERELSVAFAVDTIISAAFDMDSLEAESGAPE